MQFSSFLFIYLFIHLTIWVLGFEPQAMCVLSRHCTTESHSQPENVKTFLVNGWYKDRLVDLAYGTWLSNPCSILPQCKDPKENGLPVVSHSDPRQSHPTQLQISLCKSLSYSFLFFLSLLPSLPLFFNISNLCLFPWNSSSWPVFHAFGWINFPECWPGWGEFHLSHLALQSSANCSLTLLSHC